MISEAIKSVPREVLKERIGDVYIKESCDCKKGPYTPFGIPYDPSNKADVLMLQNSVSRVFKKHIARRVRSYSIDTACDAYELSKDLMLDRYSTWLYIRDAPTIHGMNLAFVEDTQNYIICGERSCNIESWLYLLDYDKIDYNRSKINLIDSDVDIRATPSMDLTERWIKHENGLDDLLYTLYAFFCGDPMRV